jgi:hypothetical protein
MLRDDLLTALMGAGETHRNLQRLRALELHVEAEGILEAHDEQLGLLRLGEGARVHQERQEFLLVLRHCVGAVAGSELAQGVGTEWRPEAHVNQFPEAAPSRCALVPLEARVPLLRRSLEMHHGEPDLLLLHGALAAEVVFALIEE